MSENTLRMIDLIRGKVRGLSRRITLANLVFGLIFTFGLSSAIVGITIGLESILWLSVGVRSVLFWVVVAGFGGVLGFYVVRPLATLFGVGAGPEETDIARRIGGWFPDIEDRLVNFLQLARGQRSKAPAPLVDGAILQLGAAIRDADYDQVERFARARSVSRFAAIPVIGLLTFVFVDPTGFSGAAGRLLKPGTYFEQPAAFSIQVVPGDTSVVKGDALTIRITTTGSIEPERLEVQIKRDSETRTERNSVVRGEDGSFGYTVHNVRDPFSYEVASGPVTSPSYSVRVVERPFVRSLALSLRPPAYTRLPVRNLAPNVGDVTALPGTQVSITLSISDAGVEVAELVFDSGDVRLLTIHEGVAIDNFVVARDDLYRIRLENEAGIGNEQPIQYRIRVIDDDFPGVVFLDPAPIEAFSEDLESRIHARITDDFGLSALSLFYRLAESRFGNPQESFTQIVLARPDPLLLDQEVKYNWVLHMLPGLDLVPGDAIEYFLEVRDNDSYAGYKRSVSSIQILRFPSLAEHYKALDETQDDVESDLKSLLEDSRRVRESFEQLRDELRKKSEGDWDDERHLERLREQQARLEQQASDLAQNAEDMVDQMSQHDLVSEQTLNQFQELNRVMSEINSPELTEALEKLRKAMQNLDMTRMQESIGQIEFNEEQFLERIERALELFRRLRAEQKLEEAAKRAEALAEQQEKIAGETAELQDDEEISEGEEEAGDESSERGEQDAEVSDGDQASEEQEDESQSDSINEASEGERDESKQSSQDRQEELAQEQERSAEEMKALEDLMEEIQEHLKEIDQAPQESMQQMMQEMRQQNMTEQMQDNAEQLRDGALSEARKEQQQMQESLEQMAQKLQSMQQQMSGDQMVANMALLRRSLDDVLTLSSEQEALRVNVRGIASRDSGLRRFTQQQAELHDGLRVVGDSLVRLAARIPQMSRRIQVHAGAASMDMSRAVTEMTERRGGQAIGYQKGAMTNLNELALLLSDLMDSMQNQQSGMSGMSMQQMMQQLQQMSGQQQQLNDQVQQMLNDIQGSRLSMDQQRRLDQMARQQRVMQEQLEGMQRDGPDGAQQLLGNLEHIARQMEESIREMRQHTVDSKTLQRQQEILTRLLNAQRSMRERGKENKREGRTGEEIERASPRDLTARERADQLHRELLEALESGYSADYEELIRRYFRALQDSEKPGR